MANKCEKCSIYLGEGDRMCQTPPPWHTNLTVTEPEGVYTSCSSIPSPPLLLYHPPAPAASSCYFMALISLKYHPAPTPLFLSCTTLQLLPNPLAPTQLTCSYTTLQLLLNPLAPTQPSSFCSSTAHPPAPTQLPSSCSSTAHLLLPNPPAKLF